MAERESLTADARLESLTRLLEQAEALSEAIDRHVETYGGTVRGDGAVGTRDFFAKTFEEATQHQLRGSVIYCLRKLVARG